MSQRHVGASGFVPSFPGQKQMTMLNWDRNSNVCACCRVRVFVGREILQVPVISYYINWGTSTFEVVVPMFECIVYCHQFLVMNIIVCLRIFKCPGVECDQ